MDEPEVNRKMDAIQERRKNREELHKQFRKNREELHKRFPLVTIKEEDDDYVLTEKLVDRAVEKIKTVPEDAKEIIKELVEEIKYLIFVIDTFGEEEGYTPWRALRENYVKTHKTSEK